MHWLRSQGKLTVSRGQMIDHCYTMIEYLMNLIIQINWKTDNLSNEERKGSKYITVRHNGRDISAFNKKDRAQRMTSQT